MIKICDRILFFKEHIENDYKFENLAEIESMQKEKELTIIEDIELNSLLIRYYIDRANYDLSLEKSLELKEKSEKISHLPFILMSISYILESLQPMGREKQCDELIEYGNQILDKISYDQAYSIQKIIGQYLFIIGLVYQKLEKKEESLEFFENSLIVRKKIQDKLGIAKSLLHISNIYENQSNFKIALEYLQKSLEYSSLFNPNMCSAWAYVHIAYVYSALGNLNDVLDYANKGFKISQLLGNTHCQDYYFNVMGLHYLELGKHSKSLEFFKNCLEYRKKRKHFVEIGDCYYQIGTLYSNSGDLNLALENYKKALSIKQIKKNSFHYVQILMLYGKILGEKGKYEEAIKSLEKSLELSYEHNMKLYSSKIIYYLICISLNKQNFDKAKQYLRESDKIVNNNQDNKRIMQIHKINEALILKNSNRYRDKIYSQEIFTTIINDEILQIEVTIDAMLNLIEILLFELKVSENGDILKEIHEIISKLSDLGKKSNSISLLAEIMFFQAKMALIEGNIEESRKLFTNAQNLAETHGLVRLANEISNEHDSLLAQLTRWEYMIESNNPLKERIENVNPNFLFSKEIRNFSQDIIYQKEEPIFILIWSQKGMALFEFYFEQSGFKLIEKENKNIVGILSAIDIVGKEALLSKGSIDRIKFEDKTIIVRVKDQVKFAYAFKGQSYNALKNLELFIMKITAQPEIWNNLIKCEITGEMLDIDLSNSIMFIANQIF